ncbi:hypothetical protein [Rhodococcus sp. RDE2]|uniref:hypothetical protein n=1 Tax=Rhodococcus sp. RDE2 TaxID=2885078 RepID=UPI001E4A9B67|nr:hypothetical protein [Rhodococcus sp. RDE2]BDB63430.1 hypothetical protein RDE2_52240 [Rhodococcus sp. RDE2]
MSTAVLGDPIGVADSADRLCDAILDVFESDETSDRQRAVAVCATCPLVQACRTRTRVEILDGIGPCAVVRAGVAWDYDGYPDADIHADDTALKWIPDTAKRPEATDDNRSDLDRPDENVVELAFHDPGMLREHEFSAAESEAIVLRGAKQGKSMNFLGKILRMHYRNVHKLALNLGVRDAFETKPPRKKALDEVVVELETLDVEHDIETESQDRAVDNGQLSFDDLIVPDTAEPSIPADAVTAAAFSRTPRALLRRLTGRIPRRFRAGKVDIARIVQQRTPSLRADSPAGAHGLYSGSSAPPITSRLRRSNRTGSPFSSPGASARVHSRSMRAPSAAAHPGRTRLCTVRLFTRPRDATGIDPPRTQLDPVSTSVHVAIPLHGRSPRAEHADRAVPSVTRPRVSEAIAPHCF